MNAPLPAPLALAAPRSVFITSRDGLRLHARVYGPEGAAGLPVLCLPGLARTHMDFHELALALGSDAERPRRVVCVDYRGRGLSDYDSDWRRYDIRVELDDVMQQMAALGLGEAVFVGTSRGGLITMAMGAARPAVIKGAVINDIGPVIEAAGLMRIRGYVGRLPHRTAMPRLRTSSSASSARSSPPSARSNGRPWRAAPGRKQNAAW